MWYAGMHSHGVTVLQLFIKLPSYLIHVTEDIRIFVVLCVVVLSHSSAQPLQKSTENWHSNIENVDTVTEQARTQRIVTICLHFLDLLKFPQENE
jgi:hypothetical protein